MYRWLCILVLLGSIAPRAFAATFVVPDSIATIGSALASAASGDTVLVRAGTYPETITLVDGVALRGEDPGDPPVLDAALAGIAITAVDCGSDTRVENIEIHNGVSAGLGGGATLLRADVHFSECLFAGNSADLGGAIGADDSDFEVRECIFTANGATVSGGAISVTDLSSPHIEDCRFEQNVAATGGAIAVRNGATPDIVACVFSANSAAFGAALWFDLLAAGTVRECTIVANTALSALGGSLYFNAFATPTITQSIVAFANAGGAVFVLAGADPVFGCSAIFGNVDGDGLAGAIDLGTNVELDPEFCDFAGGDYSLSDASPLLSVGGCGQIGAFGVGCSAVSTPDVATLTWTQVKAHYRR